MKKYIVRCEQKDYGEYGGSYFDDTVEAATKEDACKIASRLHCGIESSWVIKEL